MQLHRVERNIYDPGKCVTVHEPNYFVNTTTGRCASLPSIEDAALLCFDAPDKDFRACVGYGDSLYSCADGHCASMEPPEYMGECAVAYPPGYIVHEVHGRCTPFWHVRCYEAFVPDFRFCDHYAENGFCAGDYCAGMSPKGHPDECAVKMPIGWSANPLTGKCEPARTHRCYDAYKPDFRFCEGYEDLGYFCVDEHCVGMNPIGDVERCAVLRPEGWTPDLITGKCAPDSKGVYYAKSSILNYSRAIRLRDPRRRKRRWILLRLHHGCIHSRKIFLPFGLSQAWDEERQCAINIKLISDSKKVFFVCFLIDSFKSLLPTYFFGYYFGTYGRPLTLDPYVIKTNMLDTNRIRLTLRPHIPLLDEI